MIDVLAAAQERKAAIEEGIRSMDRFIQHCQILLADADHTFELRSERFASTASQTHVDAASFGDNVVYLRDFAAPGK